MVEEPHASGRSRAALFDLDGTLIDTRAGVREAIAAAFRDVTGGAQVPDDADLSLPLDEMLRGLDPSASESRRRLLSEAFRRNYDSGCWRTADLYDGADESLQGLRAGGVRVFVVTNKRAAAATRLLDHFGLAPYLEDVVGQPDTGTPIPKSELIALCIDSAGLDASTTVLIGDSDQDAAAARSSGMVFVAVTSGAGPLGHANVGDQRVEVESLADATRFVLDRLQGESLEP